MEVLECFLGIENLKYRGLELISTDIKILPLFGNFVQKYSKLFKNIQNLFKNVQNLFKNVQKWYIE